MKVDKDLKNYEIVDIYECVNIKNDANITVSYPYDGIKGYIARDQYNLST